ncbi:MULTISPECIES: HutD family protein [unclassified Streptomyces]|uniref:HutD/Ves family protein n=1 Tax=unclassified Streptomyces TaxID=2593676 RepID=UPI00226E7A9E|nr:MULTISPECIES: HutD family protein [unclassified Streptomyces]MCY0920634.1 HutD family protein [Streptomyces sp. H27-G5]MCY0962637.1 HutD family protein [Streptomyces sp. H27-H5]
MTSGTGGGATGEGTTRIHRAADRSAAPWKNGGGVTREIAVWPHDADMDGFEWRVSLADVTADGPFSAFPGVDRVLTVVEGAGMDLTIAGERALLDRRFAPRHFPGDRPTDCRLLDGPVVNFNVMYRREAATAEVRVRTGDQALAPERGETLLVVALEGDAVIDGPTPGSTAALGRRDAALLTGPEVRRLRTSGRAAVVRLRSRST